MATDIPGHARMTDEDILARELKVGLWYFQRKY